MGSHLATITGQDLGEGLDEAPGFLAAAATLFELKEVEPSVEEASVVRQLGIEFVAHAAALPQRLDRDLGEVAYELGIGDLVDAAAVLFQGGYLSVI
jgi:hypothetical protein